MSTTKKVYKMRLFLLREIMEKHKKAKGNFVKLNGEERVLDMERWDCGTSACAFGSYCLTPYGKRHFDFHVWGRSLKFPWPKKEPYPSHVRVFFMAAKHFGITLIEARELFNPLHYTSPSQVIIRIDELLEKYHA